MKRIGTQTGLSEDERAKFISALTFWRNHSKEYYSNRARYEDSFNCHWNNQHHSGTVRGVGNKRAWPFEGASDQCLRWGDTIVQDLTSVLMNATRAAEVHVTCPGGGDAARKAISHEVLLKWAIDKMGSRWDSELRELIHYYLVDSPAVAIAEVDWRKKATLAVRELSRDELLDDFTAWTVAEAAAGPDGMQMSETDVAQMYWALMDGIATGAEGIEDAPAYQGLVDFVGRQYGVEEKDAKKVVDGIAKEGDGVVEFLAEADRTEGPTIRALRYGDDFCIPTLSEDFDYASPWFRNQWVTEQQLREAIDEDGWSKDWVEETLKFPGSSMYDWEEPRPLDERKELYNIVWCYSVDVDGQGRATRYVTVLSQAQKSAFGKRVLRSRRGKWNACFFRREVASGNLIDARGFAEISSPVQGVAKAIRDGAANNALVGSLPPLKIKGTRIRNLIFEPMAQITMGTNDDALFMQPPAFPAAADKQEEKIKNELYAYAGVSNGQTDVTSRVRDLVAWWFAQMKDLYTLVLEVTKDNISDRLLAGITNDRDVKGLKRADITGDFGLSIVLDPDDMDSEKLIKKLQTLGQLILPLDKSRVIDTTPVAIEGMRLLLPGVAKESIKPPAEMTAEDIADERKNFVEIKAGVMPQMDTDGRWNYGARIQFYRDLEQQNPNAIADMTEQSRAMLEQWIAALEQQNRQYGENAEIGRTGVEGVVSE